MSHHMINEKHTKTTTAHPHFRPAAALSAKVLFEQRTPQRVFVTASVLKGGCG